MDGSQILEIRPDGIVYVDDEGQHQFIDFAEGHANEMKQYTLPEVKSNVKKLNKMTDEEYDEYVERLRDFQSVGGRLLQGPPYDDGPYVEFYTEPPTRFYVSKTDYGRVVGQTRKLGWNTNDLG